MPVIRQVVIVDMSTIASVAAGEAALNAAIPAGFFAEDGEASQLMLVGETSPRSCINLVTSLAGTAEWEGVTSSHVRLLALEPFRDLAAVTAAKTALIVAEFANVPPRQLRNAFKTSLVIGGVQLDVLVLIFSDGRPPASGPGAAVNFGWTKDAADVAAGTNTPEHSIGFQVPPGTSSRLVSNVSFVPDAPWGGDAVNLSVITVFKRTGLLPRVVLFTFSSGAAVNPAFLPVPIPLVGPPGSNILVPGDILTVEIDKVALGVVVPSGGLLIDHTGT